MKLLYSFAFINILKAEENIPTIRVTKIAHLDITVNGEPQGTVDIGLFGDQVPKTVKNFETLCGDGFKREGDERVYSYNGTRIHRINKSFMLQAGDIINQDGTGSISIYGDTFDDENFDLKHYDEQWVSMANNGPNTNGCQFFVLYDEARFLDNEHVVFAKVVYGWDVLLKLKLLETTVDPDYAEYFDAFPEDYDDDDFDYPLSDIRIEECYLSIPEEPIYVPLKRHTPEPVPVGGWLPGEEEEVFGDEMAREIDEDEIRRDDELDFPELYQQDEPQPEKTKPVQKLKSEKKDEDEPKEEL